MKPYNLKPLTIIICTIGALLPLYIAGQFLGFIISYTILL